MCAQRRRAHHGVKVVHLDVGLGADGVRHGARVLGELGGPQAHRVLDALHRPRVHVCRKLLVAVDGEPLLEGELEPVAAGDAVAGPVVEVLVPHHALDAAEVAVGGGVGGGQHEAGVEHVERLVLHGACGARERGGRVGGVLRLINWRGRQRGARREPPQRRGGGTARHAPPALAHPRMHVHASNPLPEKGGDTGRGLTHVEVVHGHDVEQVQVVLEPKGLLVPGHRALERAHREGHLARVLGLHEDAEGHLLAAHRGERVLAQRQVSRHQGEEVAGLGEGVLPDGVVPPGGARHGALLEQVAVAQEDRVQRLVGLDAGGVPAGRTGAHGSGSGECEEERGGARSTRGCCEGRRAGVCALRAEARARPQVGRLRALRTWP